jgi:hypothetical protein
MTPKISKDYTDYNFIPLVIFLTILASLVTITAILLVHKTEETTSVTAYIYVINNNVAIGMYTADKAAISSILRVNPSMIMKFRTEKNYIRLFEFRNFDIPLYTIDGNHILLDKASYIYSTTRLWYIDVPELVDYN